MLEVFRSGGTDCIVVVTGEDHESFAEMLRGADVRLVQNPSPQSADMLASIKLGLTALEDTDAQAALISPADLPLLQAATVATLITRWQRGDAAIVLPSHDQRRGHPALIARALWPEIFALAPGMSLRTLFTQRGEQIEHISVEDMGIRFDIDTPEAYQRALRIWMGGGGSGGDVDPASHPML
jgi:molybdenum cofactor cytidylyltransferase